MTLAKWLAVLAAEGASVAERNDAAGRVLDYVRSWAAPFTHRVAREARGSLNELDVDEVVQHFLTRCSMGTCRFRGTSEGEAHEYCRTVLRHKTLDLCRARRRFVQRDAEQLMDSAAADPDLGELTAEELGRLLAALADELPRLYRGQDVAGRARSLRCFVESRLGASIEEQIERYGFSEGEERGSATALRRARDRVYKYRERGREAGREALRALVAQGRFGVEEVTELEQILGYDLGPPGGSKKDRVS